MFTYTPLKYIGKDACPTCGGAGTTSQTGGSYTDCARCVGEKMIVLTDEKTGERFLAACPACGGSGGWGTVTYTYGRCPDCGGTGRAKGKESDE